MTCVVDDQNLKFCEATCKEHSLVSLSLEDNLPISTRKNSSFSTFAGSQISFVLPATRVFLKDYAWHPK